jgi:general secretion pathway protein D
MSFFNRLTAVLLTAMMAAPVVPLQARTRKGDKFLVDGRNHETKREWDAALEAYQKALDEDPGEQVYQMAAEKARFQSAQNHVNEGMKLRQKGQLGDALLEFQKAYATSPGLPVATQELTRTQEMILRERKRVMDTGKEADPTTRGLTPAEEQKRDTRDKINRILPMPELKPLNPEPVKGMVIRSSTVKVLFETVAKAAGINVLWDPEYQPPSRNSFSIDFDNTTLEQALDNIGVLTKSYWKPMSSNTIFITNDNPNKRRDYAEMVAQTFYLNNVFAPQEIQEIVNAVRSIAELQRVVAFTNQPAIIVRGEADQVALAAKMIHDLDKQRAEVVVDILVMEASSIFKRQLTAAIASTGLTLPVNFSPRGGLKVVTDATTTSSGSSSGSGSGSDSGSGSGTGTGTGTTTTSSDTPFIPLSNLGRLSTADFSTTLPSALLQATLADTKTKVLQAPQIRSVDGVKAVLKIGERQPTASGSFQPGIGGVGINPLVNTQFQFIDVGVNVELLPRVHDNGDVSMHIDLDISTVSGHVNLGGIEQPIIGQRKVQHDIRMHEGEVGLLGGLINTQDSKQVTGIPGLSSIPLLRRLFSGESLDRERGELMVLLIPHIVRAPEINASNLRGIAVGNQTSIKLNYAPKASDVMSGAAAAAAMGTSPAPAAPTPIPSGQPPAAGSVANTPSAAAPAVNPPAGAPPATVPPAPALAPPATAPPMNPPAGPDANPPAGNARAVFSPAQVETRMSSQLSASILLEGGSDVASAPITIQFDPKILRLNDVVRGDFLASDGQQPVFTKNIMNDSGTATIQLNRQPGTPGVNGGGVLVTLNFQAIGRGLTVVRLPGFSVRNSKGQPVGGGAPQLTVAVQ